MPITRVFSSFYFEGSFELEDTQAGSVKANNAETTISAISFLLPICILTSVTTPPQYNRILGITLEKRPISSYATASQCEAAPKDCPIAPSAGSMRPCHARKEKAEAATYGVFKQQTSRLRHREGGNQDMKTNQSS